MVVLFLVIVWIAVLTPKVVRRFREAGSQSSIDSFHQQLHLLERAGPKLVAPAYRLESGDGATAGGGVSSGPGGLFRRVGGAAAPRSGLALVDDRPLGAAPGWTASVRRRRLVIARRRNRKRRRDLLFGLLAIATLTGLLGAMHALHLLWAITAVSVLAIALYVALVAYAQLLTADRQAARPVTVRPMPVTPAWARTSRRDGGERLPGVEVVGARTAEAARAGYPGGWDEESAQAVPRHAVVGAH